jgi:hypothetical protein
MKLIVPSAHARQAVAKKLAGMGGAKCCYTSCMRCKGSGTATAPPASA